MDASYFLLISLDTATFEAPELELYRFEQYSDLWQFLQDELFQNEIRWYQIYWGDTLMMQKLIK